MLARTQAIRYPRGNMRKIAAVIFGLIAIAAMAFANQAHAVVHSCYARAFCPQTGRAVSCMVYSDPFYGQSCSYESKLGYGVRCTGWDLYGNWVVYQDYCIY
ncbi:MAG: hypothetical protein KGQ59_10590 [Bdellovibrionales bacterium]|nr:hypothetical protein [Bdellovibrionales bacterium]